MLTFWTIIWNRISTVKKPEHGTLNACIQYFNLGYVFHPESFKSIMFIGAYNISYSDVVLPVQMMYNI